MTLGKYGLIRELGRKETTGNPIVYGTTEKFLQYLDIKDLSQLPDLEQFYEEINEKSGSIVKKRIYGIYF